MTSRTKQTSRELNRACRGGKCLAALGRAALNISVGVMLAAGALPELARADYAIARQAFLDHRFDVIEAEIRASDPVSDPNGLRDLIRTLDANKSLASSIPEKKKVFALLDAAAELVRDGESVFRLRWKAPNYDIPHPETSYVLRYRKAAEFGYARGHYEYALTAPKPAARIPPERQAYSAPPISEREFLDRMLLAARGGSIGAQLWFVNTPSGLMDRRYKDPEVRRELTSWLSPESRFGWLEMAAVNDSFENGLSSPERQAEAQWLLASSLTNGRGTQVNLRRACALARQAAFAGNEGGQRLLALIEGCTPEVGAPVGRLKYENTVSE